MGKKTIKVHLFFVFVIQYTFSTPHKSRNPDNQVIIRVYSYPDPVHTRQIGPADR